MFRYFKVKLAALCLSMLIASSGVNAGPVQRNNLASALASMVLTIAGSGQAAQVPLLDFLQDLSQKNPEEFAALINYFLNQCQGQLPEKLVSILRVANLMTADGSVSPTLIGSLTLLKQIIDDYNANEGSIKQCCSYGCKKGCCKNWCCGCCWPCIKRNAAPLISFATNTLIPIITSIIASKQTDSSAASTSKAKVPSLEDTLSTIADRVRASRE